MQFSGKPPSVVAFRSQVDFPAKRTSPNYTKVVLCNSAPSTFSALNGFWRLSRVCPFFCLHNAQAEKLRFFSVVLSVLPTGSGKPHYTARLAGAYEGYSSPSRVVFPLLPVVLPTAAEPH